MPRPVVIASLKIIEQDQDIGIAEAAHNTVRQTLFSRHKTGVSPQVEKNPTHSCQTDLS